MILFRPHKIHDSWNMAKYLQLKSSKHVGVLNAPALLDNDRHNFLRIDELVLNETKGV